MSDITPEHPKVRAKVAEKKAVRRKQQKKVVAAAFDGPKKIGKHTFHPMNMQGVQALRQPATLNESIEMLRLLTGYILTIEPTKRIAITRDISTFVAAACDWWESSVDTDDLEEIFKLVDESLKIVLEGQDFFFQMKKSRKNS